MVHVITGGPGGSVAIAIRGGCPYNPRDQILTRGIRAVTSMGQAEQLLTAFGRSIGIDDLTWDEAGGCVLGFDAVGLQLTHIAETRQILLQAPLGHLPVDNREPLLLELLSANLLFRGTQGATLGTDGETGLVMLCYAVDLTGCDETRLCQVVQNFVQIADRWQQRLDSPAAEAVPADASVALPPGMRV